VLLLQRSARSAKISLFCVCRTDSFRATDRMHGARQRPSQTSLALSTRPLLSSLGLMIPIVITSPLGISSGRPASDCPAAFVFSPIRSGDTLSLQTRHSTARRSATGSTSAPWSIAKRKAIRAHVSQVSMLIADDAEGFVLMPDMLARFERPYELFLESEHCGDWP